MTTHLRFVCGLAAVAVTGAAAYAQHMDGYEAGYDASPDGTDITGQPAGADNPFYIPVVDSDPGLVYTYMDNALKIPANPTGGKNFVGGTGDDPVADPVPFARAQRDVPYAIPGGRIKVAYDVLVTKIGAASTWQNIGSFSTQLVPGGGTFGHIDLFQWVDPADATMGWDGAMVWHDAGGAALTEVVPEFTGQSNSTWYRRSNSFNLETNEILKLSLTDIATGEIVVHDAMGRYAVGGAVPGTTPTGFRYFVGCSGDFPECTQGNTLAWDNLIITCYEDIDEDGSVGFGDLLNTLTAWGPCPEGCPEDLDRSGDVGFSDLLSVLTQWGSCQ